MSAEMDEALSLDEVVEQYRRACQAAKEAHEAVEDLRARLQAALIIEQDAKFKARGLEFELINVASRP